MNKKRIAKEILIFFGSAILIISICGVWFLITKDNINTEQIETNQIGFREEMYNKINNVYENDDFAKIIELKDKQIFLKTIVDTSINRKLYEKSKELETYIWNGEYYTKEVLLEKYGDKVDDAINKFGFRKNNILTELSYSEFNNKIQNDTISNSKIADFDKNKLISYPRDHKADFFLIAGIILTLVYPMRGLFYLIKWSVREVKI